MDVRRPNTTQEQPQAEDTVNRTQAYRGGDYLDLWDRIDVWRLELLNIYAFSNIFPKIPVF